MWLVPTYANPTGAVVSEAGRRRARRAGDRGAATSGSSGTTPTRCTTSPRSRPRPPTSSGCASRPVTPTVPCIFASTSKITLRRLRRAASSAARADNVAWYLSHLAKRTIGPDKVNQLRHARFLGRHRRRARPDGPSPRDPRAEVRDGRARSCASGSARTASPTWTDAEGRLLREPRRRRRHRLAGRELAREAGIAHDARPARRSRTARIRATATSASRRRSRRPTELDAAIDVLATCVLIAAAEQARRGLTSRMRVLVAPDTFGGHADRSRGGPRDHRGLAPRMRPTTC